jgi:hypothetical protein
MQRMKQQQEQTTRDNERNVAREEKRREEEEEQLKQARIRSSVEADMKSWCRKYITIKQMLNSINFPGLECKCYKQEFCIVKRIFAFLQI